MTWNSQISIAVIVGYACRAEVQSKGNILVLSYSGTCCLHRTAYLAEELKMYGYNTTFVMPGGPLKDTFVKKFNIDVICRFGRIDKVYETDSFR